MANTIRPTIDDIGPPPPGGPKRWFVSPGRLGGSGATATKSKIADTFAWFLCESLTSWLLDFRTWVLAGDIFHYQVPVLGFLQEVLVGPVGLSWRFLGERRFSSDARKCMRFLPVGINCTYWGGVALGLQAVRRTSFCVVGGRGGGRVSLAAGELDGWATTALNLEKLNFEPATKYCHNYTVCLESHARPHMKATSAGLARIIAVVAYGRAGPQPSSSSMSSSATISSSGSLSMSLAPADAGT
jgi:hypothetical protein